MARLMQMRSGEFSVEYNQHIFLHFLLFSLKAKMGDFYFHIFHLHDKV